MAKLVEKWKPKLIGDFLSKAETAQRWLIPNLVPYNGLVLVSGQRKLAWKTWMADFLSLVVSHGIESDWVKARFTGPVIYFEEEGTPAGTRERWRGFERTFGLNLLESKQLYYVFRGLVKLDDKEWVSKIEAAIDEIKPLMVVFDAITYMHSKDENKTHEMRVVVDAIHRIRQRETTCVFLAHTSTEGSRDAKLDEDLGVRGSKLILDAYDSHLALRRFSDKQEWIRLKVRQREGSQKVYQVKWDFASAVDEETGVERVLKCLPLITETDEVVNKTPTAEGVLALLDKPKTAEQIRTAFGSTKKIVTALLSKMVEQGNLEQFRIGRQESYRRVEEKDHGKREV